MSEQHPTISVTRSTRCTGECRWAPKLQQAWEIIEYKDGGPISQRIEWRDVPFVSGEGL